MADEIAAPVEAPIEAGAIEGGGEGAAPETPPAPEFATLEDLEAFVSGRGGKVRIKANGADQDVPWEEAKRYLPLGRGAHQAFEEAAQARREAEERASRAEAIERALAERPEELLRRMPGPMRENFLRAVHQILTEEAAPPEERERHQRERELEELRRYRQERERAEQEQQVSAMERQAYEGFQRLFAAAMDKAQLPQDAAYRTEIMRRMAGLQRETLRRGAPALQADELLEIVRGEVKEPVRNVLRGTSVDELEELLGPELIKQLAEKRIAKVRQNDPQPRVSGKFASVRKQHDTAQEAPHIQSVDDFSRFLDQRMGRGR